MSAQLIPNEGEITSFRNRHYKFRSESRYKCPLASVAYMQCEQNEKKRRIIWLANLSQNGLAFYSEKPFAEETQFTIRLPALPARKQNLVATVVHSTKELNDSWLVGCRLDRPLTYDELELCLAFDATSVNATDE